MPAYISGQEALRTARRRALLFSAMLPASGQYYLGQKAAAWVLALLQSFALLLPCLMLVLNPDQNAATTVRAGLFCFMLAWCGSMVHARFARRGEPVKNSGIILFLVLSTILRGFTAVIFLAMFSFASYTGHDMLPLYHDGDILISRKVNLRDIRPADVVTDRNSVWRIISVNEGTSVKQQYGRIYLDGQPVELELPAPAVIAHYGLGPVAPLLLEKTSALYAVLLDPTLPEYAGFKADFTLDKNQCAVAPDNRAQGAVKPVNVEALKLVEGSLFSLF